MRMHGHGAHDDMRYVPKELFEIWSRRDPIERYEHEVSAAGFDIDAIHESVREELERELDAVALPTAASEGALQAARDHYLEDIFTARLYTSLSSEAQFSR